MSTMFTPEKIIPEAFPGISQPEVDELIASGLIKRYPAGEVLCRENAQEDTFYLLLDGVVEVTKLINNVERRLLKKMDAGTFFGEMALIHNAPRAASVTARTNVTVMEIRKDDFNRVLSRSGSIAMAMVREISARLRENDQMAIEDLRLRAGELARAYQKLAEQELARREFLTNIAHELRTPLMAAEGFLQLIQKGIVPAAELPAAIETIGRNVKQISLLVNDILFMQEMDLILPKFQPVNMIEVARAVTSAYQEKAEAAGVTLLLEAPDSLPNVSGDAKSLERALTALVDNAVKFSGEGKPVHVVLSQEDSQVVIKVIDRGIGIDPATMPRIFDRFYHMERSSGRLFGGIGLGLSITRQVIEQHNGKLEAESEAGKGTTFTIKLTMMRVVI